MALLDLRVHSMHRRYSILTTEPSGVVQPTHDEAMPVMLMTAEDVDVWLNAQPRAPGDVQEGPLSGWQATSRYWPFRARARWARSLTLLVWFSFGQDACRAGGQLTPSRPPSFFG